MKGKWKYEIIIYWSEGDQAYIAEVPELPGCAANGQTYRQALANVERSEERRVGKECRL